MPLFYRRDGDGATDFLLRLGRGSVNLGLHGKNPAVLRETGLSQSQYTMPVRQEGRKSIKFVKS